MKSQVLIIIFIIITTIFIVHTSAAKTLAKVISISKPDGTIITSTLNEHGYHEPVIVVKVTVENLDFTLDLHLNKGLLAAGYREKICTDKGDYYLNSKESSDFCYYIGNVRGYKGSTASLSTCEQIIGFFVAGDSTYSITPISGGSYAEAMVEKENETSWTCGVLSSLSGSLRRIRKRSLSDKVDRITRFIEVYIVSDNSHYSQFNDETLTTQRIKQLANGANALYNTVDMYLVVVGSEVWTAAKIIVSRNYVNTLNNFYQYKNTTLNNASPSHDNAVFLVATSFEGNVAGLALVGSMCHSIFSVNFVSDTYTIAISTVLMSHEIGHNLGLIHDELISPCPCGDVTGNCIMNANLNEYGTATTTFSTCSKSDLISKRSKGLDLCLFNIPDMMSTIYNDTSMCGNGIIEFGEDCDCGGLPRDLCNQNCCDKTTCKLVGSAKCAMGMCCDIQTCNIKIQNTICREAGDICDIPELCDGVSAFCPSDTYKQDGTACTVAQSPAYCFKGRCNNHQSQCQKLWSSTATQGDSLCYSLLNVKGSHEGSCRITLNTTNSYTPCSAENVMCGQLFCNNKTVEPMLRYDLRGVTSFRSFNCNWAYLDFGRQILTPAFVPDGAVCGTSKACVNQTCVNASTLTAGAKQCPTSCPGGICDSEGQCRCENGLSYPNCNDVHVHVDTTYTKILTWPTTTIGFNVLSSDKITILILIIGNFSFFIRF